MLVLRRTLVVHIRLRYHSTNASPGPPPPLIHIPQANVFRFGDPNTAAPVLRDLAWTAHDPQAWAIVGAGSAEKTALFQSLLGHLRLSPAPPPPGGLFPLLSDHGTRDPYARLACVSFRQSKNATGEFYDFSARFGAVRGEERVTLRQSMFPETIPPEFPDLEVKVDMETKSAEQRMAEEQEKALLEALVDRMELRELLDIPLIALSNGQTRRARILKAILRRPELLLLDEPLTGLDTHTRPALLNLLATLHAARAPRVILGLRTHDAVPDWITHIAFIRGTKVVCGSKDEVLPLVEESLRAETQRNTITQAQEKEKGDAEKEQGALVVDMRGVNVKYGPRTVLKDINWQIRASERWHLQGTN
ncbi:hypothetical protein H0H81_002116, partial [Sphagnurus paluster]